VGKEEETGEKICTMVGDESSPAEREIYTACRLRKNSGAEYSVAESLAILNYLLVKPSDLSVE
jgi:hypothetical protein